MKTTFVALGIVAALAAAAPAVAGVTGNSALSRQIDVKVAPSPSATTHSPSTPASPDDKGGLRTSRTAEPGDDKGTRHAEPGDDNGGLRTSRTAEAGDDHGGRGRGSDDTSGSSNSGSGSGNSGSGNSGSSGSGSGKHGGSDDGPNHD